MNVTRRLLLAATLCLVALPASPALAATKAKTKKKKTVDVTVMTRNVFLGADLIPLATTPAGAPFESAAQQLMLDVRDSEPRARMAAIAGEIANAKPDVVGLQEVSTWATGPRGGAPTTTITNYLPEIMSTLKGIGASYRVVATHLALHITAPTADGNALSFDNGDAVLVRKGVKVSGVKSASYAKQFIVPTQGVGPVDPSRGYNSLDVTVRGAKLHVVNTHLEAYDPATRLAQAKEAVAGPLKSARRTVLLGDLNSAPKLPKPEDRPPYNAIAAAGFVPRRSPIFSCCVNTLTDLVNWDHNVDWIMTRGARVKLVKSTITGRERTPGGRLASDHGGVVSVLRVPRG